MPIVDTMMQDLRYACRVLARSPIFTLVATLSLALGIGANTAVFSVVNAVLLKPLPIRDPASLVAFTDDSGFVGHVDYPLFTLFRARADIFAGMTAIADVERANITIGGSAGPIDPRPASVHLVSGDYFPLLGVHAARGRAIAPDDDRVPGGHPVVVISDAYWRRRFAGVPDIVGRTLTLNQTTFTVIGVAPRSFVGDIPGHPAELWIPMMMQSEVMIERPGLLTNPRPPFVRPVARLARGVTLAQASAAITTLHRQILADRFGPRGSPFQPNLAELHDVIVPAGRGYSPERSSITRPILIVWGIVVLVLVIATVNVAGLLLARAATREREVAIRLAIGAGPRRIIGQLLTEGLVLATAGGIVGVALAWLGIRSLEHIVTSGIDPLSFDVSADARVLALTVGVSLATGLVCGLAPALRASRVSLVPSLKAARAGNLGALRTRGGMGRALVVAQVALTLTLVVAAGLFARTLANLQRRNVGLDRSHILLAWTAPSQAGIIRARLADVFDAAVDRVRQLPGVTSVAASSRGVLGNVGTGSPIRVPGYVRRPTDDYYVGWNIVTPDFFSTTGIRIVAGRSFRPEDGPGTQRVAIISESLARHYFGTDNPIGKRFGIRIAEDFPLEVVGVAHDAVDLSMRASGIDMIYLPYRQDTDHLYDMCLIARTAGPPSLVAESVRRALHEVDSAVPVLSVDGMDGQVTRTLVQERVVALLSSLFGTLALGLASIGLYALVSQSVAARAQELAVRLALGGAPHALVALILRDSLLLVATGVVVGVAGALAAVRGISSELFGVSPFDPLTLSGAILLMLASTAGAAWIPARRAARTDPMMSLRDS